jgi:hypothetical protein
MVLYARVQPPPSGEPEDIRQYVGKTPAGVKILYVPSVVKDGFEAFNARADPTSKSFLACAPNCALVLLNSGIYNSLVVSV